MAEIVPEVTDDFGKADPELDEKNKSIVDNLELGLKALLPKLDTSQLVSTLKKTLQPGATSFGLGAMRSALTSAMDKIPGLEPLQRQGIEMAINNAIGKDVFPPPTPQSFLDQFGIKF